MERSQSCSSFMLGHLDIDANNNNNNNNSSSSNSNKSLNTMPGGLKLRQAIELRHARLHQMHKHHLFTGSSDSLQMLLQRSTGTNTTFADFHAARSGMKSLLQRQKSNGYLDDIDYAADLEEEADDDSDTLSPTDPLHAHTIQLGKYKTAAELRQIRPKFHKQLEQQKLLKLRVQEQQQQQQQQKLSQSTQQQQQQHHEQHEHMPSIPVTPPPLMHSMSTISNKSAAITIERRLKHEESFDSIRTSNSEMSPVHRRHCFALKRDNSLHSDSSRYSSVDSLLEARKPDPEAILASLGFGPVGSEDILSRIPKRFLKPSQVRGIDTEAFVKRLQLANTLADHSVLGYRGLTGNPDMPPSTIVAKIMERFEVNERKKSMSSLEHTIR